MKPLERLELFENGAPKAVDYFFFISFYCISFYFILFYFRRSRTVLSK